MHPANIPSRGISSAVPARALLLAAVGATLLIQFIPFLDVILLPLRLLTTFIHEGSHALAAVATGGSVRYIAIDLSGSGLTIATGGFGPVIYMAGYVGTTGIGAAAILFQRQPGRGRAGLALGAILVLAITLLWIRPFQNGLGFLAGASIACLLAAGSRYLPENWARVTAIFLGVELCLNAVFDLRRLLWLTSTGNAPNDAVFMASAYGGPPLLWAVCWAAIAAGIVVAATAAYWRE